MKNRLVRNVFRSNTLVKALILVSVYLFSTMNTSAQMRRIYIDANPDISIYDFSFKTPAVGYAAFSKHIGYTSDSGHTFIPKPIGFSNIDLNGYFNVNFTFGFFVQGVHAFSQDTVIVWGDLGACPSILRSTDRGNTYKLVYNTPYNMNVPWDQVSGMVFPGNGNIGFAVTDHGILKSTNRGQTWFPTASTPGAMWTGIDAPDANTVYVFSDEWNGYNLMKTTNGGGTWSQVTTPVSNGGVGFIDFISPDKGWMYGGDNNGSKIYYTSNGGASWTRKDVAVPYMDKMKFINDSVGYAVGYGFTSYKTVDSGRIWERLPRDNNFEYLGYGHRALHFWSNDQFWFGGNYGFVEMSTNGGGNPFPAAHFRIDTNGVAVTNTVNLINRTKTTYQYKWYKDDTLIGTSYHASYTHHIGETLDTIKLIVTNSTGSDTSIDYQYFTIPPPPPVPTITSFTPVSGSPGTVVVITGTNFLGANAVKFGGVAAAAYQVVSATTIHAVVGTGASGDVSVTTPYGTVTKPGFTFANIVTISSVSPASGPVGSTVTITGTNFSPNAAENIVHFGGVTANVTSASSTQLTVTVPTGATYQPVAVTLSGRTAYSSSPFIVTFPDGGPITTDLFPQKTKFPIADGAAHIEAADFDGDGKLDIVSGNVDVANRLTFLRNTSTGDVVSFAAPVFATIGTGFRTRAVFDVGDINGDGKLDIVAGNESGNLGYVIFRNTGTPGNISFNRQDLVAGFSSTPSDLVVADFDNDGRTDIFTRASNALRVFQNSGDVNTITLNAYAPFTLQGINPTKMRVTDIDGDGKIDICLNINLNGVRTLTILKNNSLGGNIAFSTLQITSNVASETDMYVGDLDMDGKPDIAFADQANSIISVLRNTSSGGVVSFAPKVDMNAPGALTDLRIADLNGDGKPDLASSIAPTPGQGYETEITVFENLSTPGTLSFGAGVNIALDDNAGWVDLALGDFNNDGKMDAATSREPVNVYTGRAGTFIIKICDGTDTSFTSNRTGSVYQWQEDAGSGYANIADNANFTGTNNQKLYLNDVPASWTGRQYRCLVDGVTGYVFKLKVDAIVTPSVTIHGPAALCQPQPIPFTARAVNGGSNPEFKWQLNGMNIVNGANVVILEDSLLVIQPRNGDQLQVIMTSNLGCASTPTVASAIQTLNVSTYQYPQVDISASSTSICNGQPVLLTANVVGMGPRPHFQWFKNNMLVGSDTSILVLSDLSPELPYYPKPQVYVKVMNSNACSTATYLYQTSNTIYLDPAQSNSSVSILGRPLGACPGDPVPYIAHHINGGKDPHFQWQVNGVNVGTDTSIYYHTAYNTNDQIRVIMTGNSACAPADSDTSNVISWAIQPHIVPTINISSNGNICQGGTITFTATTTNAGQYPSYQWQVNGVNVGTNSPTFTSSSLSASDQVKAILFSSENCATPGMVSSNVISASSVPPTITISTQATNVCAGSNVTFTATVNNAGSNPVYQWKKNGVSVGTNSNIYTTNTLANGDVITAELTSSIGCSGTPTTVNSNAINMTVATSITPAITISASSSNICASSNVTFTATITNPGTNPVYQWKKNGVVVGSNSDTYTTNTLANGDIITASLTSALNPICSPTPVTVNSNAITMNVATTVTPSVTIATPVTTICAGQSVTFTATPTNGGTTPGYQWQVNGANVGANTSTYISTTLSNNDVVRVILTSSATCATSSTANSNSVTMIVNPVVTPTIAIAGTTTITLGGSSLLTATITNGGSNPTIQWQDSTNTNNWQDISGATSTTLNYSPVTTGDKIRCRLTSNATCPNPSSVTSAELVFNVLPDHRVPNGPFGVLYYPNPTTTVLTLDSLKLEDKWETLEIMTLTGEHKMRVMDVRNQTQVTIYVGGLTPGVYVAVLRRSNGAPGYYKFIKR